MKFQLELPAIRLPEPIRYTDKILLIGSCFTEHMAERFQQCRFKVLNNPHGILFNPLSVAYSLDAYLQGKRYGKDDLFYLNELWNSWDHHTRFSDMDADMALERINRSQQEATEMIATADWVMITLGSAFQYYLQEQGRPVANNHRAPGQWFEKRLLDIEQIITALSGTLSALHVKNPKAKVLFTISPVRHIRDGVTENNRSKARLIESVHRLCERFPFAGYFPAYELVMDILRDYRFYDVDMVHPNYAATSFVWEVFSEHCFGQETVQLMKQVAELTIARNHRPRFEETQAHAAFCRKYAEQSRMLQDKYPYLDLQEIIAYFDR